MFFCFGIVFVVINVFVFILFCGGDVFVFCTVLVIVDVFAVAFVVNC